MLTYIRSRSVIALLNICGRWAVVDTVRLDHHHLDHAVDMYSSKVMLKLLCRHDFQHFSMNCVVRLVAKSSALLVNVVLFSSSDAYFSVSRHTNYTCDNEHSCKRISRLFGLRQQQDRGFVRACCGEPLVLR